MRPTNLHNSTGFPRDQAEGEPRLWALVAEATFVAEYSFVIAVATFCGISSFSAGSVQINILG